VPIRPLQLYADGGYQLRIRRLEGTPNYGPDTIEDSLKAIFVEASKVLQKQPHRIRRSLIFNRPGVFLVPKSSLLMLLSKHRWGRDTRALG
jgi:hypothetical protein